MVERFWPSIDRAGIDGDWATMTGDKSGGFVRHSDYAKLEAQLVELEAEVERQVTSIEILRRHAFHWKNRAVAAEYLASTGAPEGRQEPAMWQWRTGKSSRHTPDVWDWTNWREGRKPDHVEDRQYRRYEERPLYTRPSESSTSEKQAVENNLCTLCDTVFSGDICPSCRGHISRRPPKQAVTEAMVEAALNVYCVFPRIDRGPIGISTRRKVMHRALKAAMEAGG